MSTNNDSTKSKNNIASQLQDLEEILTWFEKQKNVDVEQGIEKVRTGAEIIMSLRKKLQVVQNEFEEIKKSLDNEE